MDKLEKIFELQQKFDSELAVNRNLEHLSTEDWLQKEVLAMVSELAELLEEVNYKWWKNPHTVDYAAVKEEMVDILHFFVSMCLKVGMDADELYNIYLSKNKENFLRQQGKSAKKGYEIS